MHSGRTSLRLGPMSSTSQTPPLSRIRRRSSLSRIVQPDAGGSYGQISKTFIGDGPVSSAGSAAAQWLRGNGEVEQELVRTHQPPDVVEPVIRIADHNQICRRHHLL